MSDETKYASGFPLKSRTRAVVIGLVVLLVLPTVGAAALHGPVPMSPESPATPTVDESPNLTAIAVQGGEVGDGSDSRVVLFDPETETVRWETNDYETYYDVDPLDDETLLYVGMTDEDATYAVEHNWQTGEEQRLFTLPFDSHDVDYLGDDEYAYVDGRNDTAVVYDAANDTVVWEYDFKRHFPPTAGNGPPADYSGDYTHLNDVVPVENGSKFLLSPRNFDRVMLVDRASKEVEWTLGEEDNYTILNQQHNPSLLSTDPPTVLVADSENDRIVEYRRSSEGEWDLVWEYSEDLVWPRDADRLPNGNTIVVDSRGAREVTPGRDVVWAAEIPRFLYDTERVRLGDEPGGPSMAAYGNAFDSPRDDQASQGLIDQVVGVYLDVYDTAYWALPWWLGAVEFALFVPGLVLLLGWCNVELRDAVTRHGSVPRTTGWPTFGANSRIETGAALLAAGVLVLVAGTVPRLLLGDGTAGATTVWDWGPAYLTVALLLSLEGLGRMLGVEDDPTPSLSWSHFVVASATICFGITVAGIGIVATMGQYPLSEPASLLAFSSVTVLGLNSLARHRSGPLTARRGSELPSLTAVHGRLSYAAGVAVVGVGLFVLGQGLQSAIFPLSYLALAFVLLLEGDRLLAAATPRATSRPTLRSVLGVFRYVLRPIWLALAAALGAKILGAGAMGSVVANLHLFNPVTIGIAVFVVSRLTVPQEDEQSTVAAVPTDRRIQ